jgi:hypothetical protein
VYYNSVIARVSVVQRIGSDHVEEETVGKREQARKEEQEFKKRQDQLYQIITEDEVKSRPSEEAKTAVAYCVMCINEYQDLFDWNESKWFRYQRVTIYAGVIATLVGVVTVPIPDNWAAWKPLFESLSWMRGIPAAVATVAASLLAAFNYREDAVRSELTGTALWNELVKFKACAEPYNVNEERDTSVFMNSVCGLVDADLRNWSAQVKSVSTNDDLTSDGRRGGAPPAGKRPPKGGGK